MTILNKDFLFYLSLSHTGATKEVRNDLFVWPQYHESKENYFGFEFNTGDVFDVYPLDSLISESDIQMIRNGQAKLLLSNSHEAFHYYVEGLYNSLVLKYSIPPENIILLSESADIASHIKLIADKKGLAPMQSRWMRRFEHDVKMDYIRMVREGYKIPKTLADKQYDKKYLCFNRRWRGHRTVLVTLLHATNQLRNGFVSLGKSDDDRRWEHVTYRDLSFMQNNPEAVVLMDSVRDEMINSFPELYLDNTDLVTNRAHLVPDTNYLYEQTYFSVVTETLFFKGERPDEYGRFLSEKTFKPVAMKHPFIIVSTPHFLHKFKELGYKSFSPWIDESYDEEPDDTIRMMKIVREIERLSNLSGNALTEFLEAMRRTCEHNHNLLMSKFESKDWFTDL